MQLQYGCEAAPVTLEALQESVGPGWSDILARLVSELEQLGWDGRILQIKEKFGGLRFYVEAASDEVYARIEQAEQDSYHVCEECGQRGMIRSGGWIKTLCDECEALRQERRLGASTR